MSLENSVMPSVATNSAGRYFSIEDDGESFQVYLFDGVSQVGGACFPDDGTGAAFDLAVQIGRSFGAPVSGSDRLQ